MVSRSRFQAALVAVALALAGAAPSLPAAQKTPEFGAGVSVVALPIFVTDKDGKAVGGLTRESFEIQDEGERVGITAFYEVDVGDPASLPRHSRIAAIAPRQFLFLFDLSFASPGGIVRSREGAIDFVRNRLAPTDLAAVATFSTQKGVSLLVGFTSDRGQLTRAIQSLGILQVEGPADRLNLLLGVPDLPASTITDTEMSGPEVKEAVFIEEIRQLTAIYQRSEESIYRSKVETLIDGFDQLAKALRAMQGRTQVIYLSGGFQETVLTGAQGDDAARNSEAVIEGRLWDVRSESHFGDAEIRNYLDKVMKTLAASDVIVHSLDVSGLKARGEAAAVTRHDQQVSGRESLSQIANLSGGRFIRDVNDVGRGLQEILDATRRYYLVAFEAKESGKPGRFHRLKVKVNQGGLHTSHRTGYYEREPFKDQPALARQLAAAEAVTKPGVVGELGLEALAVPYRDPEGNALMAVVLELNGGTLLEGAGGQVPLEVYGYAFGEGGAVTDAVSLNATLDLAKVGPRIREHGLQAHALFRLAPGRHNLRFLVRDAVTGRRGVRWLDVTMPAFGADLVLYPAMVMADPQDWVILPAQSRAVKAPAYPFHVAEEAFVPYLRTALSNGRTDKVCVLLYTGGRTYAAGDSFEVGAQLFDTSGNAVRIGKLALARQAAEPDGFRRIVLNVTPESVPPGDYTLRIRVKDPTSGARSEADRPVRLE